MCFCGFFRSGEVVVPSQTSYDASCYGDVLVDNTIAPTFLQVRIKASKTDQFRRGVSVFLGMTGCELCPVAAMLDYMVRRGSTPGLFFTCGSYLTRDRFVQPVRAALNQVGVNNTQYASHSFRIGAATTVAQRGIPESLIKTLGRWENSAYLLYIRTSRETLYSV